MAQTESAVQCWKEHTCARCGTPYRYLFRRRVPGPRATPEGIRLLARDDAVAATGNDCDLVPCPECGTYQPEMIGRSVEGITGLLFAAQSLLLTALLVAGLSGHYRWLSLGLVGAGLVLLILNLVLLLHNPNDEPEANKALARRLADEGRLQWESAGRDVSAEAPIRLPGWRYGGAAAALAALALFAAPDLARTRLAFPTNESVRPAVVAPGDVVEIPLPRKVESINGHWKARAEARLSNARDLGLPADAVKVIKREETWGKFDIRIIASNQYMELPSGTNLRVSSAPWVRARLPDDPSCGGKALGVRLDVELVYRQTRAGKHMIVVENVGHEAEITVAPAAPLAAYRAGWWGAGDGGVLLLTAFSAAHQPPGRHRVWSWM